MSSSPASVKTTSRIPWVDVAKGLGIALVFYGHVVEFFIDDSAAAKLQLKWIYAFHMPMFFLFSGFVYKYRDISLEVFFKRQVLSRLVPAWVFGFIALLLWIATQLAQEGTTWLTVAQQGGMTFVMDTVKGRPTLNVLMWFLICLFMVELGQFLLRRPLQQTKYLVVSILAFAGITFLITQYRESIPSDIYDRLQWWHITSALAAIVFYQVGILMRRLGLLARERAGVWQYLLCAACLLITLATYNLNEIPGSPRVLLKDGDYGNVGLFFVTAIAGSFFVVLLSQILAGVRALTYLGGITMSLMCLNGLMLGFLNPGLSAWVLARMPEPGVAAVTGVLLLITVVSLLVCIPITWFLDKYCPYVFGRGLPRPKPAPQPEPRPEA